MSTSELWGVHIKAQTDGQHIKCDNCMWSGMLKYSTWQRINTTCYLLLVVSNPIMKSWNHSRVRFRIEDRKRSIGLLSTPTMSGCT